MVLLHRYFIDTNNCCRPSVLLRDLKQSHLLNQCSDIDYLSLINAHVLVAGSMILLVTQVENDSKTDDATPVQGTFH